MGRDVMTNQMTDDGPIAYDTVIGEELNVIRQKRSKSNPDDEPAKAKDNLFGIALSGGGIRSATINLGVLHVLNELGILRRADYLSTVSGGGYIGGYVHAKLNKERSFDALFDHDIDHLRKRGDYLTPGSGGIKWLTRLRLAGAFVFSFAMNWVSILLLLMVLLWSIHTVAHGTATLLGPKAFWLWILPAITLIMHFFLNPLRHWRLWPVNTLYWIEGLLLVPIVVVLIDKYLARLLFSVLGLDGSHVLLAAALLLVTGFFANPNLLTFHRFYRDRLASAYLRAAGKGDWAAKLWQMEPSKTGAPYPLINTCLNLMGERDERFAGTKGSDYFLLSPKYCGSDSTGYVETDGPGYRRMTLSTAVAVSGAAVNPNRGTGTNKYLAVLMTLLNLRLGYWAWNPKKGSRLDPFRRMLYSWWPQYHIAELFSGTNTNRGRVSISDGGHIENLGIFELLRRKCKLIIAIDAGADPRYGFFDLRNLAIRAKNELGVSLKFRQKPEDLIRPSASDGFSQSHFVLADIEQLPREKGENSTRIGLLVYVKSSLRPPCAWQEDLSADASKKKDPETQSREYKNSHAAFPHESTADQFFDEQQWNAYYYLGRFMAGDLVKANLRDEKETHRKREEMRKKTIDHLHDYFSSLTVGEDKCAQANTIAG